MTTAIGNTVAAHRFDAQAVATTLTRQGYECEALDDRVVVQDPVQSSTQGVVFQDVVLCSDAAAARFMSERS